ncbi:MAG: ABC transporter permease [Acidobacteriota bacterium]|nr:ABC transporter permease [Acidobacteriota bacterium]
MSSCLIDLVRAARTLIKARAFTAVCVISLGLGMSVVIAILLFTRNVTGTPPGIEADDLAELVVRPRGQLLAEAGTDIIETWSYQDYLDVRAAATGATLTAWSRGDGLFRPSEHVPPIALPAMYASSNYFSTIGATLQRGPGFTPVDDASRAEREAVISHRMWQVHLGSDPGIIGRSIIVNQVEHVVVGVASEGFRGHVNGLDEPHVQLWLPLSRHPRLTGAEDVRLDRRANWIRVVARLTPGTTVAHADAAVHSAMAALAAQYPASNREKAGGVEPYFAGGAGMRSQIGFAKMMMFGLSGMVLLVVGLNISGMMLARSAMREREHAIQHAMGATRWRLMRYHLSEALVMAVWGGSLASLLLFVAPVAVAWALDAQGPTLDLFRPDVWLALQCLALCFVTSVVLGLVPALRFSRPSIISALKNDSTGSGRRVGRLQRWTAAAQAGLAVPLLVIAGVQFDRARVAAFTELGFQAQGLYAARLNLASVAMTGDERRLFLRTVQETLALAPGVTSVSVGDGMPLDFIYRDTRVTREGESVFVTAHTTRVGAGYLQTIGTRLLAGRMIDASDREGTERVVALSQPLAAQLFPGGNPIGARVAFAIGGKEPLPYTVVGVTADVVSTQMGNPRSQLFLSLAQEPASTVVVIARGAPSDQSMRATFGSSIAEGLRTSARQTARDSGRSDADVMFRELITGESLIENSQSDLLTGSGMAGAAASVALVLAALGVYGVIAFMVATRTREIGVRVALGASRVRVVREVLGSALVLVVPGIGAGLLAAVLWVRLADPAWYPLGGVEPVVYSAAAAVAFDVAVLAGIPSARRAAAVQPLLAMKAE